MKTLTDQKQCAIGLHDDQAFLFQQRYAGFDPYASAFHYGRMHLNRLMDSYLPVRGDGLRLLDVGCGVGHYLADARSRGFEAVGIDGSEEMLKHARAKNSEVELRHGDIEQLPFADASFDVVLCIEVLRYLSQPEAALKELVRVLKPGGLCLTTLPSRLNLNGYWLLNRVATSMPFGRVLGLVPVRQFFASSPWVRKTLMQIGFDRPAIHGVYMGPVSWIERFAPKVLPRFLKAYEGIDQALTDRPLIREFTNIFLIRAQRQY